MYRTIAVGTDGSPRASKAVGRAVDLAKTCGAELHMVCAYKPAGQAMVMAAGADPALAALPSDEQLHDIAARNLDEHCKLAVDAGVQYKTHVVPGSAAQVLLDIAEDIGADVIVVGNRGMTGVRRVLGSVPNSIAHHCSCDLMIVATDD